MALTLLLIQYQMRRTSRDNTIWMDVGQGNCHNRVDSSLGGASSILGPCDYILLNVILLGTSRFDLALRKLADLVECKSRDQLIAS